MEKIGEEQWKKLMADIADKYQPGELIPHHYLRKVFVITTPSFDEFESQDEFIEAVQLQQFEYMSLVEKLRDDILDEFKMYMKNVRGDGYTFLIPEEQTEYAKARTMQGIRKEMKRGFAIMQNVRFNSLTTDKKRQNADELAKLGQLQHLLKAFR